MANITPVLYYLLPALIAGTVALFIAWYNNKKQKKNALEIERAKLKAAQAQKTSDEEIQIIQRIAGLLQKIKHQINFIITDFHSPERLKEHIKMIRDSRSQISELYGQAYYSRFLSVVFYGGFHTIDRVQRYLVSFEEQGFQREEAAFKKTLLDLRAELGELSQQFNPDHEDYKTFLGR